MADPAWPCATPEANYFRLVGPGAAGTATTLASSAAWETLAISDEVAVSVSALNTVATAPNFEGVGGASSATKATELNTALQLLAGWAQEKAPIAASGVAAYETAVSSMIPAELSIANRTQQAADTAINPAVLGALTPAIVALDTEYFGEHWPHNSGVGAAYGAALAGLIAALAIPPPLTPLGASPLAPVNAAAAVAQAVGTSTMSGVADGVADLGGSAVAPIEGASGVSQFGSLAMQPMQAAISALQPIFGMFSSPIQAFQGMAGLPQSMMGSFGGILTGMKASEVAVPGAEALKTATSVGTGSSAASLGGITPGGHPGSGLTSYTRPTSSFHAEAAGRPVSAKNSLLSAEMRGPTSSGAAGGAMPLAPGSAGMLGTGRGSANGDRDGVSHARIALLERNSPDYEHRVK